MFSPRCPACARRFQTLTKRRSVRPPRAAESARVSAGERNEKRAAIAARWESSPEGQAAYAYFGGLMLPLWLIDDGELDVTIPGVCGNGDSCGNWCSRSATASTLLHRRYCMSSDAPIR